MPKIDLTNDEFEVLRTLMYENPCRAGCVWESCEKASKRIKDEEEQYNYCYIGCKFFKSQLSLQEKIEAIADRKRDDSEC